MNVLFFENIKTGVSMLRRYKLRAGLTIISVIIGVTTIMLVSSIMNGIRNSIEQEIEKSGSTAIYIYRGKRRVETSKISQRERIQKPLTVEDAMAINDLPSVETAVSLISITSAASKSPIQVKGEKKLRSSYIGVHGADENIARISTKPLKTGRWFTGAEDRDKADVAVINSMVAHDLFGDETPIGKDIQIAGREFMIIGILEQGGGIFTPNSSPREIYIPLGSAFRISPVRENVWLLVESGTREVLLASDEIEELLRNRRRVKWFEESDFRMDIPAKRLDEFKQIMSTVYLVTISITSLTLLVGGIGVMNIMLVSVTSRLREIGLRKTVGAKRSNIVIQFLVEASLMTGLGGIIGVSVGWMLTIISSVFIPPTLPIAATVAGLLVSITVGVVFGAYPAWKASKMNPVDAINSE